MEAKTKSHIRRSATTEADITHELESRKQDADNATASPGVMRKAMSVDSAEAETIKKSLMSSGTFKRRSVRRRSSKRVEPEFGHDTETYEKIREQVLQERAVTNAIDALQERWRMIMFMYDDCVALNEDRKERKLKKLCVQRQFELIMIIAAFLTICLPITIVIGLICR